MKLFNRIFFTFFAAIMPALLTWRVWQAGPEPSQHSLLVSLMAVLTFCFALLGNHVAGIENRGKR